MGWSHCVRLQRQALLALTIYLWTAGCGSSTAVHVKLSNVPRKAPPIPLPWSKTEAQYTTFRCAGNKKDISSPGGRLCVFHNLCSSGAMPDVVHTFYKHDATHPILFDEKEGYLTDFESSNTFLLLTPRPHDNEVKASVVSFTPKVVSGSIPKTHLDANGVYLLWEKRIADDNIGHLIWEDFFSMWVSLRSLNLDRQTVQVLNMGTPCEGRCRRLASEFVTKLLGRPIKSFDAYASVLTQPERPVCFHSLVVGGYTRIFSVDTTTNRALDTLLYEYRAQILETNGFDPRAVPSEHHIVLVQKESSNRKTLRNIVNLHDVKKFLGKTYPGIRQSMVEWSRLSMSEQFGVLMSATIVVTPAGGCSTLLPFLPYGAHAIIMDYNEGNRSISLEGEFWDHWSHVKTDFYLVQRPEQYIWEEDCPRNVEKDCESIIVDVNQLQVLIDGAITEMSDAPHIPCQSCLAPAV